MVNLTYVEKDEDGNITLSEERDYISIATTRPEPCWAMVRLRCIPVMNAMP